MDQSSIKDQLRAFFTHSNDYLLEQAHALAEILQELSALKANPEIAQIRQDLTTLHLDYIKFLRVSKSSNKAAIHAIATNDEFNSILEYVKNYIDKSKKDANAHSK